MSEPAGENVAARPYVGLRPYEPEERDLFFGRDWDAKRLRNEILSSRLLVLYAPMGAGKTSLLKTLVFPDLVEHDAEVVFFERWEEPDPLGALSRELAARCEGAAPAEGEGRLEDLARRVYERKDKTPVLVLDQFEKLLRKHGGQVFDQLGRELGRLVRSDVRARVVISIRQEFLAGLEIFREHLPNLMQATFHLGRMGTEGGREAIEEPAKKCGRGWDPNLVGRLLKDLRADPGAVLLAGAGEIELPFLQIVCKEMWEEAERRGLKVIPEALYDSLGRTVGIIDRFVGHVVSKLSRKEKCCAARLLRFLAPRIGVKSTLPVEVLVENVREPQPRVVKVLGQLRQAGVLRTSDTGGGTQYELYHDAFTRVLRPWADRQLQAERTRRRGLIAVLALVSACLVGWGGWRLYQWGPLYTETTWRVKELAGLKEDSKIRGKLDTVVQYLRPKTIAIPQSLARELKRQEGKIPVDYGLEPRALRYLRLLMSQRERQAPETPESVIRISYDGRQALDKERIEWLWPRAADILSSRMGIPVPRRMVLAPQERVASAPKAGEPRSDAGQKGTPGSRISYGGQSVNFDFPALGGSGRVIDEGLVPGRLRAVFEALQKEGELELLPEAPYGGRRWWIPHWAAPLWMAAGQNPSAEEERVVLAAAAHLERQPEPILTEEVTARLAASVDAPRKAAEALKTSGGFKGLREVLAAVLNKQQGQKHLAWVAQILEELPKHHGESADKAAENILATFASPDENVREGNAALPVSIAEASEYEAELRRNRSDRVPPRAYHVYLGADLAAALVQDNGWKSQIAERLEQNRRRLYLDYGIRMPNVQREEIEAVSGRALGLGIEGSSFAIAIPFPTANGRVLRVTAVRPDQAGAKLNEALVNLSLMGAKWLVDVPDSYFGKEWLEQRFAATDLRSLLRASGDWRGILEAEHSGKRSSKSEPTAAHSGWLMGSVLYWSQGTHGTKMAVLADCLRKTARARNATAAESASTAAAIGTVEQGLDEMMAGRDAEAARSLQRAAALAGAGADAAFLRGYAERAWQMDAARLTRSCEAGSLDEWTRYEIAEWLEKDRAKSPAAHWRLCACLASSYLESGPETEGDRLLDALMELRKQRGAVPARDELEAAQRLLPGQVARPLPDKRRKILLALYAGVIERANEAQRQKAYQFVDKTCRTASLAGICRDLRVLAAPWSWKDHFDDSLYLTVELANSPRWRGDLDKASEMILQGRRYQTAQKPADRGAAGRLLDWAEARMEINRADYGDTSGFGRGEKILTNLVEQMLHRPATDLKQAVYERLVSLCIQRGDVARARAWMERARKDLADAQALDEAEFFLLLAEEKGTQAEKVARERWNRSQEDADALFNLALVGVLNNSAELENTVNDALRTDHRYRDCLRLMLYWRLKLQGQARRADEMLRRRWREIKPASWSQREQDPEVWPEMLVGYFRGEVTTEQILGPLRDDKTFQSSALGRLGLSRLSVKSDARFYSALAEWSRTGSRGPKVVKDLNETVATHYGISLEYHMARILLK